MAVWSKTAERDDKDIVQEAVTTALTSLNNQSPHLDVYKKESISGEGALWLALISTSSPNKTLLLLSLTLPHSQYDIDDSRLDKGFPHWWNKEKAFLNSLFCDCVRKNLTFEHSNIFGPEAVRSQDLYKMIERCIHIFFWRLVLELKYHGEKRATPSCRFISINIKLSF